ncbi:hypothetical protein D3C71_1742340 [compost metagenome]
MYIFLSASWNTEYFVGYISLRFASRLSSVTNMGIKKVAFEVSDAHVSIRRKKWKSQLIFLIAFIELLLSFISFPRFASMNIELLFLKYL